MDFRRRNLPTNNVSCSSGLLLFSSLLTTTTTTTVVVLHHYSKLDWIARCFQGPDAENNFNSNQSTRQVSVIRMFSNFFSRAVNFARGGEQEHGQQRSGRRRQTQTQQPRPP